MGSPRRTQRHPRTRGGGGAKKEGVSRPEQPGAAAATAPRLFGFPRFCFVLCPRKGGWRRGTRGAALGRAWCRSGGVRRLVLPVRLRPACLRLRTLSTSRAESVSLKQSRPPARLWCQPCPAAGRGGPPPSPPPPRPRPRVLLAATARAAPLADRMGVYLGLPPPPSPPPSLPSSPPNEKSSALSGGLGSRGATRCSTPRPGLRCSRRKVDACAVGQGRGHDKGQRRIIIRK